MLTLYIAIYWVDKDCFIDGGEEKVFLGLFNEYVNIYEARNYYNQDNAKEFVEGCLRNFPSDLQESAIKMGVYLYCGKGYITEDEEYAILNWC